MTTIASAASKTRDLTLVKARPEGRGPGLHARSHLDKLEPLLKAVPQNELEVDLLVVEDGHKPRLGLVEDEVEGECHLVVEPIAQSLALGHWAQQLVRLHRVQGLRLSGS